MAWHVRPGEEVRVDQPLVDVMTDKATVTIPSGLVAACSDAWQGGRDGSRGAELVSFDTSQPPACRRQMRRRPGRGFKPAATPRLPFGCRIAGHRSPLVQRARMPRMCRRDARCTPQASPAVRRRARELQVDLQHVHGSGPNGRITHADVDVHLRSEVSPCLPPRRTYGSHTTEIQMVGLRRRIAEKMVVSNTQIPHFSYIEEIDITELESLREHLNASRTDGQPKLTYLPFIMLVGDAGPGRFPQLNAHYDDQAGSDHALRGGAPGRRHANRTRAVRAGGAACGGDGPVAGGPRDAADHRGGSQPFDLPRRAGRFDVHSDQPRPHGRAGGDADHQPSRSRASWASTKRPTGRSCTRAKSPFVGSCMFRLVRSPRSRRRRRGDIHPMREGLSGAPGDDFYLDRARLVRGCAALLVRPRHAFDGRA